MYSWEPWQRDPTTSPMRSWTKKFRSAITAFQQVWHAVNSATPRRMRGTLSSQPRCQLPSERIPTSKSFDIPRDWVIMGAKALEGRFQR